MKIKNDVIVLINENGQIEVKDNDLLAKITGATKHTEQDSTSSDAACHMDSACGDWSCSDQSCTEKSDKSKHQ